MLAGAGLVLACPHQTARHPARPLENVSALPIFLTADELRELTGYQVARCQIEWLRSRAWRFETNAAGAPKVARAYFERRMVGEAVAAEPEEPGIRPNFAALAPAKTTLRRVK